MLQVDPRLDVGHQRGGHPTCLVLGSQPSPSFQDPRPDDWGTGSPSCHSQPPGSPLGSQGVSQGPYQHTLSVCEVQPPLSGLLTPGSRQPPSWQRQEPRGAGRSHPNGRRHRPGRPPAPPCSSGPGAPGEPTDTPASAPSMARAASSSSSRAPSASGPAPGSSLPRRPIVAQLPAASARSLGKPGARPQPPQPWRLRGLGRLASCPDGRAVWESCGSTCGGFITAPSRPEGRGCHANCSFFS